MDFLEFELSCARYLSKKYSDTGCKFIVNGGMDSTAPDIIVKKDNKVICNIEVKEPNAQCSQFVAFPDVDNRTFIYSPRNHPPQPSIASLAILNAMAKDFDKHKTPSNAELGLNKQLYYDRIIDYYVNYKKCTFFMTRESVDSGEFIIFKTVKFKDYFDVTACYRPKRSGSHNPNAREIAYLPKLLQNNNLAKHEVIKDGKYINVKFPTDCGTRFKLEGKDRLQFKKLEPGLYRVTSLGSTNNANVIFSIKLKEQMEKADWEALEKVIN